MPAPSTAASPTLAQELEQVAIAAVVAGLNKFVQDRYPNAAPEEQKLMADIIGIVENPTLAGIVAALPDILAQVGGILPSVIAGQAPAAPAEPTA